MDAARWNDTPDYPTQYRAKAQRPLPARAKPFVCRMGRYSHDKMVDLTWDGIVRDDRRVMSRLRLVHMALPDPHHRIAGTSDRLIVHTP
jgi:hypothetical protein